MYKPTWINLASPVAVMGCMQLSNRFILRILGNVTKSIHAGRVLILFDSLYL